MKGRFSKDISHLCRFEFTRLCSKSRQVRLQRATPDCSRRTFPWSPTEMTLELDSYVDREGQKFSSLLWLTKLEVGLPDEPDEESMRNENLSALWTPARIFMGDDRNLRSTLWESTLGSADSPVERYGRVEMVRDERRKNKSGGETDEQTLLLPLSDALVESHGPLLGRGFDMHGVSVSEAEEVPAKKMGDWERNPAQRRERNSIAERLTALLKPRPGLPATDVEATTRERRFQELKFERRVSQLNRPSLERRPSIAVQVSERVPPEWVLLLLGCLLGLSTGISVVGFNKGVHFIHELAWAGTPHEGAAWLRTQRLADTWHRILLIPVVGGVVVGMFHSITEIVDMIRVSQLPRISHSKIDWLGGIKPVVKALQAAITLGTGLSLGPEGPSVDIGKSWAHGYSEIMRNSKERRIALVAAGAAAGIASGFNAPVAGTFFAIETVLRPQHAENSPPLTTAMIILAAVISSTVSQVLLGERPAFTVPPYELRSAAELPLYILLGAICGIMSVIFSRLVAWLMRMFDFLKDQLGIPISVTPAIGGLLAGLIALRYPGVLYWGFTNVDEILKSGFTATAPGQGLLAQLTVAKIVATAICKGSGLVGGLYAPSLFIGSAGGAVYGSIVGKAMNAALPGHNAVAHPQAYALVGMAALLASVCSVPLTSVLLLFELTKDYHILLPLMGAVGLAIWVAAVGNQKKSSLRDPVVQQNLDDGSRNCLLNKRVWRQSEGSGNEIELCTLNSDDDPNTIFVTEETLMADCDAAEAMSRDFVKVNAMATVKETLGSMLAAQQHCALIVDENDLLEGIMTFTDLQQEVLRAAEESVFSDNPSIVEVDTMLVVAICTRHSGVAGDPTNLVVCYPDTNLHVAKELMLPRGLHQLPVVTRIGSQWQDRGHKVVGVLHQESIPICIRAEASKRIAALLAQKAKEEDFSPLNDTH